jgi:hypothetical protein
LATPQPAGRRWKGYLWSSLPRRAYTLVIACFAVVLVPFALFYNSTPPILTQFAAVTTCVVVLLVGLWRAPDVQALAARIKISPSRKLFVLGGLGAVFVETEYEVWQHVFGATGVAASPNLMIDLLVTMPWYLLMLAFLGFALKHSRPTLFQLLIFGGIYELMSDGLLGSYLAGTTSATTVLLPVILPIFTLVYSPIVTLPALAVWPSYLAKWREAEPKGSLAWLFFPCFAILIYGAGILLVFRQL